MKILFYIESLRSGGKERRMVELIKGLSKNGNFDIMLVLTKDDIHYKELSHLPLKFTIRKKGLKKDPAVFFKFFKIAKKFKPDIIHVWGNLVAFYAIPAKVLLRIPMLNSQVADAPKKVSNSLLGHKLTFLFSNVILSNSKAGLNAYNAPKNKSKVIYNGFDFNRIGKPLAPDSVRQNFNITTPIVIGMVASFSDKKDYKTYILAANNVLQRYTDVTFLCIGSGDYSYYKSLVEDKNKEHIKFLGKQSGVERIMNICDIGVLATYTEGISNALLEFSALGKPVVATDGGGTCELIDDSKTGFLVKEKSVEDLSEKIEKLLHDSTLRQHMGDAAKSMVQEKFSITKMVEEFIKTYEKARK